jgi:hypothetical protein
MTGSRRFKRFKGGSRGSRRFKRFKGGSRGSRRFKRFKEVQEGAFPICTDRSGIIGRILARRPAATP